MAAVRGVRIEAKGAGAWGAGGGMKVSLAEGGRESRFVRSKEWQKGCGWAGGGESLFVSCRGGVVLCAAVTVSHTLSPSLGGGRAELTPTSANAAPELSQPLVSPCDLHPLPAGLLPVLFLRVASHRWEIAYPRFAVPHHGHGVALDNSLRGVVPQQRAAKVGSARLLNQERAPERQPCVPGEEGVEGGGARGGCGLAVDGGGADAGGRGFGGLRGV